MNMYRFLLCFLTIILHNNLISMESGIPIETSKSEEYLSLGEEFRDIAPEVVKNILPVVENYIKEHFTYPLIKTIKGDFGFLVSVAFIKNDVLLATTNGETIKIVDKNSKNIASHTFDFAIEQLIFNPSGDILAVGSDEGDIALWDFKTDKIEIIEDAHNSGISALSFNPQGSLLASGSGDGIKLWDVKTLSLKDSLNGFIGVVTIFEFSPTENLLASRYANGTIHLWDLNTKTNIKFQSYSSMFNTGLAFSQNGKFMASNSNEGLKLWDLKNNKLVAEIKAPAPDFISSIAFSPVDPLLAYGAREAGDLTIYNLKTRKFVSIHKGDILLTKFSPTGNFLASFDVDTDELKLYLAPHATFIYLNNLLKTYQNNSIKTAQVGLLFKIADVIEQNAKNPEKNEKINLAEANWMEVAYNNFPTFMKEALKDLVIPSKKRKFEELETLLFEDLDTFIKENE